MTDTVTNVTTMHLDGGELVLVVLGEGGGGSVLQQRVVVQQHSHVVEHLGRNGSDQQTMTSWLGQFSCDEELSPWKHRL